MRLRYILILFILVIIGLAIFFLQRNTLMTSSAPLRPVIVRLSWLKQAQYAGMFVALEKGFYKDAGLDVTFKEYQDGLDQGQEVADGKVNFAITTGVALLNSVNMGKKVKAIAVIYQTTPESFAALSGSGIVSPKDWKGKVLGSKGGNKEAVVLYKWLLTKFGIPRSSVVLKDLDYSITEGQDLQSHRADVVDIYRNDQTRTLETKGIKYNLITPETYGINAYGDNIIASDALISDNPQLVQAFVQATLKGWEYALSHRSEAIQVSTKYANPQYEDPLQEAYIYDKSVALIEEKAHGAIGSMNYITWNNLSKAMIDDELLRRDFDVTTAYTTKFLNK